MFDILYLALIGLAVVEYITTAYGLLSSNMREVNPLLRWMKEEFGTWLMLSTKLFGTAVVFIGIWISQSYVVVCVLGVLLLIVCTWNIRMITRLREKA